MSPPFAALLLACTSLLLSACQPPVAPAPGSYKFAKSRGMSDSAAREYVKVANDRLLTLEEQKIELIQRNEREKKALIEKQAREKEEERRNRSISEQIIDSLFSSAFKGIKNLVSKKKKS